MGLEELEEDIRQLEQDLESLVPQKKAASAKLFLDQFMPLAILMLTLMIAFHIFIPVSDSMAVAVSYMNVAILFFFSARFTLAFMLADSHKGFLREHWFDALLVLPAFALVKDIRLLLALESRTEERAVIGTIFARNTTVASQLTKIITWIRRILRF